MPFLLWWASWSARKSLWLFCIKLISQSYDLKCYLNKLYTCKSNNGTIIWLLWFVLISSTERISTKKLLLKSLHSVNFIRFFVSQICNGQNVWLIGRIDNTHDSSELDWVIIIGCLLTIFCCSIIRKLFCIDPSEKKR